MAEPKSLEDMMAKFELKSHASNLPYFEIDVNDIQTPTGEYGIYGVRLPDQGLFAYFIPDHTFLDIYIHPHSHRQNNHEEERSARKVEVSVPCVASQNHQG
jgi:hypothetical protein